MRRNIIVNEMYYLAMANPSEAVNIKNSMCNSFLWRSYAFYWSSKYAFKQLAKAFGIYRILNIAARVMR